jgi:hypothetical protein
LTLLSQAPVILKNYLGELKPLLAMVRLRLFETLSLLPPNCLDGSYAQLLRLLVGFFEISSQLLKHFIALNCETTNLLKRLLIISHGSVFRHVLTNVVYFTSKVSEFTLTDGQTGASTSLLPTLCHSDDAIILVGPQLATSSSTQVSQRSCS